MVIESYAPVLPRAPGVHAHTLVLGTMPSVASLREREYYAHPRNAFWTIVAELLGFDRAATAYEARLARLADAGFVLWDVLRSCQRAGSLDADIVGEVPNDIAGLLAAQTTVRRIVFNGHAAAQFFRRHVLADLLRPDAGLSLWARADAAAKPAFALPPTPAPGLRALELVVAPSTSPAFTMPYAAKRDAWRSHLNSGDAQF